jgi:FlaA1/EpsC-like NDP-sugar epimerase/lipopolysaccharide/colanic/teichoic acid biosynthesis glycosyltransferase
MTPGKRALDLAVAIAGLALTWPILLVVAALIKLDDGGPVFFRQARVGRHGRGFQILKFRTMSTQPVAGPLLTVEADPRITRMGRGLRALKLDELPQLFNVLAGDMTLVGPRPEVPRYVEHYSDDQRQVLDYVPGITDPASLHNWDEAAILARAADPERVYLAQLLPEKIRRQLEYSRRAGVGDDLAVMGETVRIMALRVRTSIVSALVGVRQPLVLAVHTLLIVVGYRLACDLRFDFAPPPDMQALYWRTLPLLIVLRLTVYWRFGMFQGYWRHVGAEDLGTIGQAATVSSVAFVAVAELVGWLPGLPRSVLAFDWLLAMYLTGGIRLLGRAVLQAQPPATGRARRRTLVVGAGNRAEYLVREFRRDPSMALEAVGIVVDSPGDHDRTIHNVRVAGTIDELAMIARQLHADFVIIALDAPSVDQTQRIVAQCTTAGLEFKTVPTLKELLDGSARADQLRSLRLEDLLGRAPVSLDMTAVEQALQDKVVLVTGGAGSIGSELARQIARCQPSRLVLLDQAESALYFVTMDIEELAPGLPVVPVVCDVAHAPSLSQVFADHQPQFVFHAAAYKHVPMMEVNVVEAVRNNVFGTVLVADAAATWGAEKFVLISTDKAVNPSSVMGASKRIAERAVLGLPSLGRASTDFRAVRFGNVLGSAGSVVPLFERQLVHGGPLTVTHPDVERYFMTIPEAAQLVLQAATLPEASGRLTLLDMGEPVRVLDLAEKLIRLSGQEPYRDIEIVFTGLRPGEKLREELQTSAEATIATEHSRIRIVRAESEDGRVVRSGLVGLLGAVRSGDAEALLGQIRLLVPQCEPPLRIASPAAPRARPRPVPARVHAIPMLDTLYEERL